MRDVEEMVKSLIRHRAGIIKTLSSNDWRHFRDYFYIKEGYLNNRFSGQFKRCFCSYYVMNGARGLNKSQQSKYFKLLFLKETNLKRILRNLYSIPGYGKRRKLFFSFATKLFHTVDGRTPIYDGNIAHVLALPKQANAVSLKEKIENRVGIYEELKSWFKVSLKNPRMKKYLKGMRVTLRAAASRDGLEWKDNLLSDTKLLDSCLWALYSVSET